MLKKIFFTPLKLGLLTTEPNSSTDFINLLVLLNSEKEQM